MFAFAIGILLFGFPVAFTLSGTAILFALFGVAQGVFDWSYISLMPERIYGVMGNETLMAVPLFIFMGMILAESKISDSLLETAGMLFGRLHGGLGISICIVGALLAASTGIVGATVVTMGLLSLPVMLKYNYKPSFACGIICASGTLGQIIPPSIILVILGDVISSANQQAQLAMGNFSPQAVSVGDLFIGAVIPGLLLVLGYIIYIVVAALINPNIAPPVVGEEAIPLPELLRRLVVVLIPPLMLIVGVLGSILGGLATPTEAASVGCVGGMLLTIVNRRFSKEVLKNVVLATAKINCMVFTILIGSSFFSLVFRGFHGDDIVADRLNSLPGGVAAAFVLVMVVIFILGFFLDFFEITFVVVPIVGPILIGMGLDPIWLGVMIAMNLQTSFLTPPFGFALFYLRGVADNRIRTYDIYKGVIPFIVIQVLVITLLWFERDLITSLPKYFYGL